MWRGFAPVPTLPQYSSPKRLLQVCGGSPLCRTVPARRVALCLEVPLPLSCFSHAGRSAASLPRIDLSGAVAWPVPQWPSKEEGALHGARKLGVDPRCPYGRNQFSMCGDGRLPVREGKTIRCDFPGLPLKSRALVLLGGRTFGSSPPNQEQWWRKAPL